MNRCTCPEDWQGMDHTVGCKARGASPRTFTPHELATLTSDQVEALPMEERKAFFIAAAQASDPFYPWHLEEAAAKVLGAGAGMPIPLPDLSIDRDLTRDLDPIASDRRFEIGE